MKVFNFLVQIFVVFAFLTIGSLMIMVSLQVLSMEDALLKVQDLYENPWQSLKAGTGGVLFIFLGLVFAKWFVRNFKPSDDLVLYGKWGPVSVSVQTIDELIRRVLRKFQQVKIVKIKTDAEGNHLKVIADLSVAASAGVAELIQTIQKDLGDKIQKILGGGIDLEVSVNVVKIVDEIAAGKAS